MSDIEKTLSKLTIPAKVEYLTFALDYVSDLTKHIGLPGIDAERLRLTTEEACLNVIEHAFDPEEEGSFDIVLKRRPNRVVVSIEDKGLPIDFRQVESGGKSGLGITLMRAFTDEMKLINLGNEGKRVELVKNLPHKHIDDFLTDSDKAALDKADKTRLEQIDVEFRFMKADEAYLMARCVYRSYGYSYVGDFIYFPEKVEEYINSGVLRSVVAVDKSGEIVGHLGVNFETPESKVGETGQAVVDPRYRGHKLFEKMKNFAVEESRKAGLYGMYSESVTIHPYTQRGNMSLGAHETGFLIAFVPTTIYFKKIQEGDQVQRQSTVLFYLKINDEPERTVYLPEKHKDILLEIYERNNLRRTAAAAETLPALVETTEMNVIVKHEIIAGFLRVNKYGKDFEAQLRFRLRELCEKKMEVVYIDLPLGDPHTAQVNDLLESMGFFLSGIIPELMDGDILRYQYLNNISIDPDKIIVASDFGKKLLKYIFDTRISE